MSETIRGMVEHIVFRSEQTGYTVFTMKCSGGDVTCVGTAPEISEGEYLRADGDYTEHPVYGRQFTVRALALETPEDEYAIERYLGSGVIKGVGPRMAARIVAAFGKDTFRVMEEEPERLSEIRGISERGAASIYRQFHAREGMRQAMMYMGKLGITTNLAFRIYKQYGDKIYSIIEENPYRLAEDMTGVGFRLADDIARNAGIEKDSEFRIRSGILYILQQAARDGHSCYPLGKLSARTAQMLDVAPGMMEDQLASLQIEGKIVVKRPKTVTPDILSEGEIPAEDSAFPETEEAPDAGSTQAEVPSRDAMVYLSSYYRTELEIAFRLRRIDVRTRQDPEKLREKIRKTEKESGLQLDERQMDAVMKAAQNGVLVITGGPGTGKTTTINAIIRYFEEEGSEIELAAPTGRAAKRMSEATGHEARTIHRLLEVSGAVGEENEGQVFFGRNEDEPLETDVVVIDEMSMVDMFLMNSLLKAIAEGTKLILVGDVDQLPSVGPGHVLGDIIDSGCFEVVSLTKIFRQAAESEIVTNAHRINAGEQIRLDNHSRDFFCIRRSDVRDILGVTVKLARDSLPAYVGTDAQNIQVLTPMRKGELGVERLNMALQAFLNPPAANKREKILHQTTFREGDKVMQVKNNYQLEWKKMGHFNIPLETGSGIFNGDIGFIREINLYAEQVVVEYDEERRVTYSYGDMDEVELAYAVTIHKSQGSEYPAVILPLLSGPRLLMNRNLLYTAVTRARKCVVIVGSPDCVRQMIGNESQQKRYTSLAQRIEEAFQLDPEQ